MAIEFVWSVYTIMRCCEVSLILSIVMSIVVVTSQTSSWGCSQLHRSLILSLATI